GESKAAHLEGGNADRPYGQRSRQIAIMGGSIDTTWPGSSPPPHDDIFSSNTNQENTWLSLRFANERRLRRRSAASANWWNAAVSRRRFGSASFTRSRAKR